MVNVAPSEGDSFGCSRSRDALCVLHRELAWLRGLNEVVLFGGSFDPPHGGHFELARNAEKVLRGPSTRGSRLVWMMTPRNPLKKPPVLSEKTRQMRIDARLSHGRQRLLRLECLQGFVGTRQTLAFLNRRCPRLEVALLCGSDELGSLRRWRSWSFLRGQLRLLVVRRALGPDKHALAPYVQNLAWSARRFYHQPGRLFRDAPPRWLILKHGRYMPQSSRKLRGDGPPRPRQGRRQEPAMEELDTLGQPIRDDTYPFQLAAAARGSAREGGVAA